MTTCAKQSTFNNISRFDKCANCGACYNACPAGAIALNDGLFYSLKIDETRCINCGRCVSVCPVNTPKKAQNITAAYGAQHKDIKVIEESSSGGAFSALADHILAQGGIVYGACFSEDFNKVIFKSTADTALDSLRRSKYVESLVGDSFKQIKELLSGGTKVLFCGTPCQVAGLKRVIGENENLYTVDFSCGGLPSHKLYNEHLAALKEKYKSEIAELNFRCKHFGWGTHCITATFKNGKKYTKLAAHDPYFAGFLSSKLTVREYCYECAFSDNHYADLILADYWRYYDAYKNANRTGISLILVNSPKGEALMSAISGSMDIKPLPLEKATYNIKPTKNSKERYQKRAAFLQKAEKDGLKSAAKEYCLSTPLNKTLNLTRFYLKKITRR